MLEVDRKCASRAPSDKAPELRIDRACLRSMTKLTDGEFDAWLARREARRAEIVVLLVLPLSLLLWLL